MFDTGMAWGPPMLPAQCRNGMCTRRATTIFENVNAVVVIFCSSVTGICVWSHAWRVLYWMDDRRLQNGEYVVAWFKAMFIALWRIQLSTGVAYCDCAR